MAWKSYTAEQKAEAVKKAEKNGIAQTARELGISASTITRWRAEASAKKRTRKKAHENTAQASSVKSSVKKTGRAAGQRRRTKAEKAAEDPETALRTAAEDAAQAAEEVDAAAAVDAAEAAETMASTDADVTDEAAERTDDADGTDEEADAASVDGADETDEEAADVDEADEEADGADGADEADEDATAASESKNADRGTTQAAALKAKAAAEKVAADISGIQERHAKGEAPDEPRLAREPGKLSFGKKNYSLKTGKTLNLAKKLELTHEGAVVTFVWKTSDPKVASVNQNGVVEGLKKGTAKITVTSRDGLKARARVKVSKK